MQGSSPLTRGKRDTRVGQAVEVRLIPAHAGKTPSISSQARPTTAHPRSRGENLEPFDHNTHGGGSSPLTRGKRNSGGERVGGCGLIPAHAGKTDNSVNLQVNTQAHPRSRGENAPHAHPAAPSTGSSPLTRGKRRRRARTPSRAGLIPAHAGKTERRTRGAPTRRAHPRSRGENPAATSTRLEPAGSSPLTRGKHLAGHVAPAGRRLIPAHAGKTESGEPLFVLAEAHPRSRGENDLNRPARHHRAGSSPLTRGKPRSVCRAGR